MIVTGVPGSMTEASDDAPRQSSPSTLTRPADPGPIRSVTIPVLPSRASTPVRRSDPGPSWRRCMSRGRNPAMLTMLDTANARPCETKPSPGIKPTTPATAAPTPGPANPNPRREHLSDEEAYRQEKPNQPIFHMVLSCNPCTRFAIQLAPTPCGAAMIAR